MAVDNDWDLYAVVRSCISIKKSTATKVASPPSISSVSKWLSDSWEPELENQINGPSTEFLKSKADAFQTMEEFYQPFLSNPTVGNYITTPTITTSTARHVSAVVTVPNSLTSFTFGLGGSSGGAQHQPQQKKNDFDLQPAANINTPHFNSGFIPFSGFERFCDHQQLLLPKLEKPDENGFAIMPAEAAAASPSLVRILPRLIRPRIRKRPDKKMVCRVTSENLSSDLWGWRKYGTKPIKGSPNPRNYYRCSSSKGCSARKQVERSPDDPDIFIVTFSGDHSHPRPGHFSSLAGSTRDKTSTVTPDTIANNNCVEAGHVCMIGTLPICHAKIEDQDEA